MTPDQRADAVVGEYAPAKLNLSLDVLGRRSDGFHELRSVMQTISLHDKLRLWCGRRQAESGLVRDFSLVDRAIEAVLHRLGRSDDVAYELTKTIPVAAGLGGGSSDAAAAIRGTCRLLQAELPSSELHQIAASLGSDVPFFIEGGTALVEGRGERVERLDPLPETWFLLAGHGKPVSTRHIFETFSQSTAGDGHFTDRVLEELSKGRVVLGGNDLQVSAIRAFPEIGDTLAKLSKATSPDRISMSGSGGTFVAIFSDWAEASETQSRLRGAVPWTCVAKSVEMEEIF